MIRKVRYKLVLLSMAAILLSITALALAINLANYYQTDQALRRVMEEIAPSISSGSGIEGKTPSEKLPSLKNGSPGRSGSGDMRGDTGTDRGDGDAAAAKAKGDAGAGSAEALENAGEGSAGSLAFSIGEEGRGGGKRKEEGRKKDRMPWRSAEAQYGGRFFSVLLSADGTRQLISQGGNAISDAEAAALSEEAEKAGRSEGYLDGYRYILLRGGDMLLCHFLDCSTEISAMRRLQAISLAVGGIGALLSFLLVYFLSGRVVWPLQEAMEKQKRFIADAGHELKTPLSVLGTNLDLLQMDLGENEWLESSKRQIGRLRKLVGSLLSLSKMEDAPQMEEPSRFSLSRAAEECLDTFQGLAERGGKRFEAELEEGLQAQGNLPAVQQLLSVLCDNAVKYAEGQTIWLRLYKRGKLAVFETENEWDHAVEAKDMERLFERFFRGDSARSKKGERAGYGLGLSIARAAAKSCGGDLRAFENEAGRIVFRFTIRREMYRT